MPPIGNGPQARKPGGHSVARGVCPASRRLVAPLGHHLGQAEPDAGVGDRPADQIARIHFPADEERTVLLRSGRRAGAWERELTWWRSLELREKDFSWHQGKKYGMPYR